MTDLFLSEESKQYQDLARDFYRNEVAVKSEKLDHEGVFPKDLYKAAWELGLAATLIPEQFGGLGLPLWDSLVMAEEAGAASGGLACAFEGNALAISPLLIAGSDSQKEKYLTGLTAEAGFASYCFKQSLETCTFPAAAATFRSLASEFEISAGNLAAINGENAGWYLLLASDADGGKISAFVLPADLPGIVRGAQLPKLGRRAADICAVDFNAVNVGREHLLGELGQGAAIALQASCISAAVVAAHATGLMRCGLEHSLRYSKERQTFGKPIAKHQAVSFLLADMAKDTECARLMTWKAGTLFDGGCRDHIPALSAKTFALDAAMKTACDAVQVFGGYGYSKEYPVERLMRDAKMMQMMAGGVYELKCRIGEELLVRT